MKTTTDNAMTRATRSGKAVAAVCRGLSERRFFIRTVERTGADFIQAERRIFSGPANVKLPVFSEAIRKKALGGAAARC